MWWLPRATGWSAADLARELGVHKSTLSRAPGRLQRYLDEHPGPQADTLQSMRQQLVAASLELTGPLFV